MQLDTVFTYEIFDGSKEARHQHGKMAMAQKYLEYTRRIKQMGIKIKAHFIIGFGRDGWWHMLRLWKFASLIRPQATIISLLTPLPGSFEFDHDNDVLELKKETNGRRKNLSRWTF